MKQRKEAISTYILFVIILGLEQYSNWRKSEQIEALETVIKVHKMYSTEDKLKSTYIAENIAREKMISTLNDSLTISFDPENLTEEKYSTDLHFAVSAKNKLGKQIRYIKGTLTVMDSSKIVVTFPIKIGPDLLPNTTEASWRQSWNMRRYIPAIIESLRNTNIKSITTEWKTSSILFEDGSALLLKN